MGGGRYTNGAAGGGVSRKTQRALAWLLARKAWIAPIPGTTRLHRLKENLGAANVSGSPGDVREIDARVAKVKVHGHRYPPSYTRAAVAEPPLDQPIIDDQIETSTAAALPRDAGANLEALAARVVPLLVEALTQLESRPGPPRHLLASAPTELPHEPPGAEDEVIQVRQ